jgi:hypothetical protein
VLAHIDLRTQTEVCTNSPEELVHPHEFSMNLQPGRVYRTRELGEWAANAPRLARRLVDDGQLVPLAHGLFACPKRSRFGVVPPTEQEIMRGFLEDAPFVFTGPERWNALGLGTTAQFATPLVYNTKRSGLFKLGNRHFLLRRVAFPTPTPVEWFVVDLLEHAGEAAASAADIAQALTRRLSDGAFDAQTLRSMARAYGTRATAALVEDALTGSGR